jgi:hypothetical protein
MSLCYDFEKWTIISLTGVTISLTIGLIMLSFAFADYLTAQTAEFKTLTNNKMKFSILFPSNWQFGENLNESDTLGQRVWFESPDRSLPIFIISTKKVEPYLDTDTMTLKNTSLQQHVQQELQLIQQELNKSSSAANEESLLAMALKSFKIIRQNAVTVGGNSGWKLESTFSWQGDPFYAFRIYTIANGKVYTLEYEDDSLKVPERLPIIKKMVESFKVIK